MARPLKDGLTYFQHDVNMSADEKLEALEAVHGNDGYAVYNKLLERIYKSFGKLDLSDDVQRLSIARKCNVSAEKFEAILADAFRFRLFDRDTWEEKKLLTSERIRAQLETVEEERERWRKKAEGENPSKSGLSPEKTPVIPGENPSYPDGKVHKAEQSRAEQSKEELASALVDNFPKTKEEEASFFAFCLSRAKEQGAKRPVAYTHTLEKKDDVARDWRESLKPAAPPEPSLPPPMPCGKCNGDLMRYPGQKPDERRCSRCGTEYVYDLDYSWIVAESSANDFEEEPTEGVG
jgi:hypothetical protein